MKLHRTEAALLSCKNHLRTTNMFNTDVENYLVSYLLTVTYSEIEEKVKIIIERRANKANDRHIVQYIVGHHKTNTGRIKISDITDLLSRFGQDYKSSFTKNVHNSPIHAAWDNIVLSRMKVAHGSGVVELTIPEFESALIGVKSTLIELSKSFSLTDIDIADLL